MRQALFLSIILNLLLFTLVCILLISDENTRPTVPSSSISSEEAMQTAAEKASNLHYPVLKMDKKIYNKDRFWFVYMDQPGVLGGDLSF
jgi:hypothetical protein